MDKFIGSLVYTKHDELLIEAEKKWFDNKVNNEPAQIAPIKKFEHISALREYARKLYDQDIINYNAYRQETRRSDHNWIKTVLRTGTTGDKMSANCILVQDSAVHNLSSVENLLQSVKINKKRECMLAIDALKDLFVNYLLPDSKLKSFSQNPFEILPSLSNENNMRDKRLLIWYYESMLKDTYSAFVQALQGVFSDTLATSKFKVTHTMFDLIVSNPYEQVRTILETLVNKLGDPEYKVASRIIYDIKNYLVKCPKMKMDVLLEIERLVSRPNINQRAQYYGFCCMNQFVLKRHDSDVANRLLLVYFAFFKKFIKNKEIDTRMLNALLTGVNRAYKYAKMNHEEIDKNLNTLFKLVHVTSFNVSIQALMLLNQVMDSREDMIHRYYNAMYKKMFELEWRNTSKQTYFLNLLFNSIKKDEALPRVKAFVKRLLQICFSQNVPFNCGSFMLISEIMKIKSSIFQFDSCLLANNNILANASEKTAKDKNGLSKFEGDDDELETFKDAVEESDAEKSEQEDGEEEEVKEETKENKTVANGKSKASWDHQKNIIFKRHDKYDCTERNPLYCGADKTLTFELLPFTRHYHPTVVVFANKLLNNEPVDYTGDPMNDFTLIHFLDRFVYKNPKKNKNNDSNGKKSIFEAEKSIYSSTIKNMAVNSKEYLKLDPKEIPAEEKFFYDYYKARLNKKADVEDDDHSEAGTISDTEFDDFLEKTETDGIDGKAQDFDLDFADGIVKKSKKQKKKKIIEEELEDDDDDNFMDDEDDEDFEKAMAEDSDIEMEFDSDLEAEEGKDDFNAELEEMTQHNKKKKRGTKDLSSLFAAADEFTDLVNESSKYDDMGVGSISNKDKSNPKQLKWEMNRLDSGIERGRGKGRGGFRGGRGGRGARGGRGRKGDRGGRGGKGDREGRGGKGDRGGRGGKGGKPDKRGDERVKKSSNGAKTPGSVQKNKRAKFIQRGAKTSRA